VNDDAENVSSQGTDDAAQASQASQDTAAQSATDTTGSLLGGASEADGSGTDAAATSASGYEKFAVPEGFDYDDAQVNEFTTLARAAGLSQEQAQKFVDLFTRHWLGWEEQLYQQQEKWRNETMSDAEFGGQKFAESLRDARRFIDAFGGERLRAALETAGVGNHPELFKAFARAGRALGEDRLVSGAAAPGARAGTFAELANSMYPDMRG